MPVPSTPFEIRSFDSADTDGVIALWHYVFGAEAPHNQPQAVLQRKLVNRDDLLLVARANQRVVGTALAGYDGHRGWLYAVAVHPEWRRLGIGTALLRTAESRLAALGCVKLNLQIRASNARVEAFYRRLGYHVEARINMGKILEY